METATSLAPAGTWPHSQEKGSITLAYDDRHRRRLRLSMDDGTGFMLDLPKAAMMREGDGLKLAGGGYVHVHAAPEALLEIIAASPQELARFAWHIGNRHLAAEIAESRILIRDDYVIAEMLRGLGARVRIVQAPFNPESGAYEGRHEHAHGREHDHAHGHRHHEHGG